MGLNQKNETTAKGFVQEFNLTQSWQLVVFMSEDMGWDILRGGGQEGKMGVKWERARMSWNP